MDLHRRSVVYELARLGTARVDLAWAGRGRGGDHTERVPRDHGAGTFSLQNVCKPNGHVQGEGVSGATDGRSPRGLGARIPPLEE